jgi:hypothetical protein
MSEEDFDDFLNEVYPPYHLGEYTFYPSQILKNCDPILYRIMLSEMEIENVS